eukprot:7178838-Prymnesium_polylepis.2
MERSSDVIWEWGLSSGASGEGMVDFSLSFRSSEASTDGEGWRVLASEAQDSGEVSALPAGMLKLQWTLTESKRRSKARGAEILYRVLLRPASA